MGKRSPGKNILPRPGFCMSIEQEADGLRGRDRSFPAVAMDEFGNRRSPEILSVIQLVPSPHNTHRFDVDRFFRVDLRSIIVVYENAAAIWINAGVDRGAVNNGRARINRMVV